MNLMAFYSVHLRSLALPLPLPLAHTLALAHAHAHAHGLSFFLPLDWLLFSGTCGACVGRESGLCLKGLYRA